MKVQGEELSQAAPSVQPNVGSPRVPGKGPMWAAGAGTDQRAEKLQLQPSMNSGRLRSGVSRRLLERARW